MSNHIPDDDGDKDSWNELMQANKPAIEPVGLLMVLNDFQKRYMKESNKILGIKTLTPQEQPNEETGIEKGE